MNLIKAQKAIEVNFLKTLSYEEINDILRGFNEKLTKAITMLEKFSPCDEDGNGEFIYNDGSEEMGVEVDALLKELRGGHE